MGEFVFHKGKPKVYDKITRKGITTIDHLFKKVK